MGMISAGASAIMMALSLQAAPQHADPAAAPPTQLRSIIVDGRRLEEAARAYVEQVGEPPRGTRLARWSRPVCVSMTNMQPRFAQFVIDRIAANTLDAGADVGGPGCRPNVIILATMDGPALARRLVDEAGLGFRPAINHTNLTRDALANFQNSDAPVRWWNVVMPVTTDTGDIAIALRGDSVVDGGKFRMIQVRDGSRIRSNIRYDMAWTIVIIDMNRTNGVPLGVLADYVSMVSLAQVDAEADLTGQDTVMNLFEDPAAVDSLTQWDKDYLAALYATPPDRVGTAQQEGAVVRTLTRQRRADDEAARTPVVDLPGENGR